MNEKDKIIRSSIIAGLTLWGFPNRPRSKESVSFWSKKLNIDLIKPEKVIGSGLMWCREKDDYSFHESRFSERIIEQSEQMGFEDEEECFGNSMIDDSEYVFNLNDKGFTGCSTKEELLDKKLKSKDGNLYTCWAGEIYIYEMDIDSVKEAKKFIRKLIKERR
uniref:Uncharacterized protein n=1 Tax=viral metagenome TaxID=1070528 RepID=A0A6H2A2G0_9ZZZZ